MPQLDPSDLEYFLRTKWAKSCGQRVRERRVVLKMTLAQASVVTGVPLQTISRVERGDFLATDRLKITIAQALQTSPGALWPWPEREQVAELAGAIS